MKSDLERQYDIITSYCFANRKLLKRYKDCICLYCGKEYPYTKVSAWVQDEPEITAICPFCGVDAVVPKSVDNKVDKFTVTEELRQAIKKYYF